MNANPDPQPVPFENLATFANNDWWKPSQEELADTIVFESWPRDTDLGAPSDQQFPGWPISIDNATQQ